MNRAPATALLALLLVGCPKSETSTESSALPGTSSASANTASAHLAPSGTPSASAAAAPAAADRPIAFAGTYTSAPTENLDAGWTPVNFRGEDGGVGLGSGKIELTVDFASGRVTGTVDAPVGPAVVSGFYDPKTGEVNGMVSRKNVTDDGLSGSLQAKMTAAHDGVQGKLQLSSARANLLRVAPFDAKPTATP
jgi:hypothetical protein